MHNIYNCCICQRQKKSTHTATGTEKMRKYTNTLIKILPVECEWERENSCFLVTNVHDNEDRKLRRCPSEAWKQKEMEPGQTCHPQPPRVTKIWGHTSQGHPWSHSSRRRMEAPDMSQEWGPRTTQHKPAPDKGEVQANPSHQGSIPTAMHPTNTHLHPREGQKHPAPSGDHVPPGPRSSKPKTND